MQDGYISATAYAKKHGIGPEMAKQMCRDKELDCYISNEGNIPRYMIKEHDNNIVPYEKYEKVLQEKERYKTQLDNIKSMLKGAD